MNNEAIAKVLKELVELALLNAKETASLINDGDPLSVPNAKPGSLSRANYLRGTAEALCKTFDHAVRGSL